MPKWTVPKDIRDEISNRDLEAVRAVLQAHILEPLPDRIDIHSAIKLGRRRDLHLILELPNDRFGENAKYVLELTSASEGEPWKLGQITIHSKQTVSGRDDPISVIGALEPDTVAKVVEYVSRFWSRSGAGPAKIVRVSSNVLPPLRLPPEFLRGKKASAVYVVHARSLVPTEPSMPPGSKSTNVMITSSSSDSVFSIWLTRDERGQLVTTDVYPTGFPVRDEDRLDLLRRHVEQRSDPSAAQQRMKAALSVLPDTVRALEPQETLMMLHGQIESFMLYFPQAQVSDRRRVSGMVNCSRIAGTDGPWRCSYQVMSVTQKVPEQTTPIMLRLDVDEDMVDKIAAALQTVLTRHPSMAHSRENVEINVIGPDIEHWKAYVRRGRKLYRVIFRYEGAVEILAVEPEG